MIDGHHGLSITKQAKALGISRGSVHYLPRPVSPANLAVMRWIDELRIPIQVGHIFRDEAGRRTDLMSDGVPR